MKSATKYEPADEATGIIGLLPYEPTDFESFKRTNFLYHMKSANYIDHLIFSIFLKFGNDGEEATSHIKLGGFDQDSRVLRKGQSMTYLKTESTSEWQLSISNVTIGDQDVLNNMTFINDSFTGVSLQLYPNLPFIYIPPEDFTSLAKSLKKIYNETVCDGFKCVFKKACREVFQHDINFTITIRDKSGKTAILMLDSNEMLISGDQMSGGNNK